MRGALDAFLPCRGSRTSLSPALLWTDAIFLQAARALYALPSAGYLLILLTLRSLHHAAEKDLLQSETYKRLNLSFAISALVAMSLSIGAWITVPPDSIGSFAPRYLETQGASVSPYLIVSTPVCAFTMRRQTFRVCVFRVAC